MIIEEHTLEEGQSITEIAEIPVAGDKPKKPGYVTVKVTVSGSARQRAAKPRMKKVRVRTSLAQSAKKVR